jgi:hypothetical protein
MNLERPQADEHSPYFSRYIDLVPDGDIIQMLEAEFERDIKALERLTSAQAHSRYAPDKWSVLEVIGHLSDAERVFTYRALRFARGDETPLEGFDENAWMKVANFDSRSLASLLEEWRSVRAASLSLYKHLESNAWLRRGPANGVTTSVRALAFKTLGHELHHRELLKTRYNLEI